MGPGGFLSAASKPVPQLDSAPQGLGFLTSPNFSIRLSLQDPHGRGGSRETGGPVAASRAPYPTLDPTSRPSPLWLRQKNPLFWGPRDKAPSSVRVSVATASLETRATHMLGCSGRGGRGGTAASTVGSSSIARATARQAALASARTGIVRAIALPLGPLLADSQAALAAARPSLHARHALADSGTPQPSRTRCGARGRRR